MEKIGPVFGEFITTEKINRRGNYHDDHDPRGMRTYLVPIIVIAIILIVLLRLFFIQIIRGNYYRSLSDTNRIKTIIIHGPRGIIFDRSGKPLVYNVPGFRQTVDGKTKLISHGEAIKIIA